MSCLNSSAHTQWCSLWVSLNATWPAADKTRIVFNIFFLKQYAACSHWPLSVSDHYFLCGHPGLQLVCVFLVTALQVVGTVWIDTLAQAYESCFSILSTQVYYEQSLDVLPTDEEAAMRLLRSLAEVLLVSLNLVFCKISRDKWSTSGCTDT